MTLAALLVILTIIAIFVAYTVPDQWSMVMARDRDRQTIFIMRQYARAIYAFQEKHKTFPVGLKQIQEARQPRLIRGDGELENPLTGEMDWILIPPGQQQAGQLPPGVRPPTTQQPRPLNPSQGQQPGNANNTTGPFAGVRPGGKTGQSFISLNGADTYEQWSFTVDDLRNEIMMKNNALAMSK
ncbi:MAG TPA: hypothetical protein VGF69_11020 [Thermoanaerobaculia bacterium]|jgi:type II secretory pathway pseudopilin PulG